MVSPKLLLGFLLSVDQWKVKSIKIDIKAGSYHVEKLLANNFCQFVFVNQIATYYKTFCS